MLQHPPTLTDGGFFPLWAAFSITIWALRLLSRRFFLSYDFLWHQQKWASRNMPTLVAHLIACSQTVVATRTILRVKYYFFFPIKFMIYLYLFIFASKLRRLLINRLPLSFVSVATPKVLSELFISVSVALFSKSFSLSSMANAYLEITWKWYILNVTFALSCFI